MNKKIYIFFDGSCSPYNPGGAMLSSFVIFEGKKPFKYGYRYTKPSFNNSNNVAEYEGLLLALETVLEAYGTDIDLEIYGDSQLVIFQMTSKWKIKEGRYVAMARKTALLVSKFKTIKIKHVFRELNVIADSIGRPILQQYGISEYATKKPKRIVNKLSHLPFDSTLEYDEYFREDQCINFYGKVFAK